MYMQTSTLHYVLYVTRVCFFQDEKNQIMKSNVWLRMVSVFPILFVFQFTTCNVLMS